jgi:hypothetical protein
VGHVVSVAASALIWRQALRAEIEAAQRELANDV